MVDTETGWYGYAAPTPAQPVWPEQATGYYTAYPVQHDPLAQQWATAPAPEPQYAPAHDYSYAYSYPQQEQYPQQQYAQQYADPYGQGYGHGHGYGYTDQQQYGGHGTYGAETLAGYEQEFYGATEVLDEIDVEDLTFEEPEPALEFEPALDLDLDLAAGPDADPEPEHRPAPVAAAAGGRAAARAARCRTSRRRSVVLTIAVPTVAVLGIGAAAAGTLAPRANSHPAAANDASGKLTAADKQAQAEAAAQAKASAEQVSRDKARQALTLRTAAAKKAAAEAPRYVLPITAHTGLSALFGQAGTHWMSLHTGIDFPVSTGTQVHAVTDGTVSTKWNAYYGNMLILTAPDGTQTWYCHLSAYKKRSGSVKAGDVIAYSGDTGNSTGPHLHFEVHPHGGTAIDPLPWLLSHGLDPR